MNLANFGNAVIAEALYAIVGILIFGLALIIAAATHG